jgi:hypothetical protein
MSVELIHLRKLLQLLYAGPGPQRAMLRAEIRNDRARDQGTQGAGGDFYGPFWSDVKEHVFGNGDLAALTEGRIDRNKARERLYPTLQDGFLKWWNEQRRWTNSPFEPTRAPAATFKASDILTIKIENILAVRDATETDRYIYPYFYESPALKNEAARIALWVFSRAFPALPLDNFRILDVPRGRVFSPDRCYLEGDEAVILKRKHFQLWSLYVELEEEYDR